MDIKESIKYIVSKPTEIHSLFYQEKVRSIFSRQIHDENLKRMEIDNKDVFDTIKNHFPEAIFLKSLLIDYRCCGYLIKLKNVDFIINIYGRQKYKYIETKCRYGYYTYNIPNLIEYMREIDRLMPEWEKEFAQLLVQYENEIKKVEHKSVLDGTEIRQILENRIKLRLMECRKNNTLLEIKKSFENIHVRTNGWCNALYINTMDQFEVWFQSTEFNVELLEQIDKIMPAWIEELHQWNREYEKLEKEKCLSKISITELIKQKMKQFGYEYSIVTNKQSISLYVRLEKARMFKLSLPYRSMEIVRKRLDMIAEAVKAINNIHNAFRITNDEKSIDWKKYIQQ